MKTVNNVTVYSSYLVTMAQFLISPANVFELAETFSHWWSDLKSKLMHLLFSWEKHTSTLSVTNTTSPAGTGSIHGICLLPHFTHLPLKEEVYCLI